MLNLLYHGDIRNPNTPAYIRQLRFTGDDGKPSGGDLSCILDVTQTVILPEWDRVTFVAQGIIA